MECADEPAKYRSMFERRLRKGQFFQAPYLGCREFAASVEAAAKPISSVGESRPLGWMLYDFDYGQRRPLFFEASLNGGVMRVPSLAEVRR
jgi:CRISPR-associated protein Cas5d